MRRPCSSRLRLRRLLFHPFYHICKLRHLEQLVAGVSLADGRLCHGVSHRKKYGESGLMDRLFPILLFIGVFAAALLATHIILRILRRRSVFDRPNERSSHTAPTPRGGGWALVIVLVPVWSYIGLTGTDNTTEISALSGCALALALMSWHDDLNG